MSFYSTLWDSGCVSYWVVVVRIHPLAGPNIELTHYSRLFCLPLYLFSAEYSLHIWYCFLLKLVKFATIVIRLYVCVNCFNAMVQIKFVHFVSPAAMTQLLKQPNISIKQKKTKNDLEAFIQNKPSWNSNVCTSSLISSKITTSRIKSYLLQLLHFLHYSLLYCIYSNAEILWDCKWLQW